MIPNLMNHLASLLRVEVERSLLLVEVGERSRVLNGGNDGQAVLTLHHRLLIHSILLFPSLHLVDGGGHSQQAVQNELNQA